MNVKKAMKVLRAEMLECSVCQSHPHVCYKHQPKMDELEAYARGLRAGKRARK